MPFLLSILLSTFLATGQPGESKPPIVDFEGLEPLLHKDNDTTYVINFWATWCVPCVHELPYLEKLTNKYGEKKVKVYLVSLDFSNRLEKSLYPFLEENDIRSEVIVLDDPKANSWINKVSEDWSGAIPATLAYNGNRRLFQEGNFRNYDELKEFIQPLLKEEK